MLKMVETTTKYPGKVRTGLQKVCMAVCEHVGTDFVHFWGVLGPNLVMLPQNAQNPVLKKVLRPSKIFPDHVESKFFQNSFVFGPALFRHVQIQSYTPSAGMCTPCQGIL